MAPRLLIISNEPPVPAIHGGRVDQWSRYQLFRNNGVKMLLATWTTESSEPSSADRETLGSVFDEVHLFRTSRDLPALMRRLLALPRYSPHVQVRNLNGGDLDRLAAAGRTFGVDAVWLDGLYGGETAIRLAGRLGVPMFYRSHNVEFAYMRSQAAAAIHLRDRIAWRLAGFHLEAFETRIQKSSQTVFDISQDDLRFWRSRGVANAMWCPTLLPRDPTTGTVTSYADRQWDIVYLGNLNTPNNLRGLEWFLRDVVPHLRTARPETTIRIAGSNPDPQLRQRARASNVDLLENPPDATAVLSAGRVLINPIFSGSGINVKAIEMLFHDAHLVATPPGIRGLPREIGDEFHTAETAIDFAALCTDLVGRAYTLSPGRITARRQFGPDGILPVIEAIEAAGAIKQKD